jgi:hypothetical protein
MELKLKFTVDLEEGTSKSIEISGRDRVRDKLNIFCAENNINNEDKRSLIKTISQILLEEQRKYYISKKLSVKLDKQEIKKLMEEFNSWKREAEAKVKVQLNKYETPIINNNSRRIANKKVLAPVHERLYANDIKELLIIPHTTKINLRTNKNLTEASTTNNEASKYSAVLLYYKS